ncbi:hypothetical protein F5Y12DRAFT_784473 [Xylaria sp. FL1777]|nr:hypothetical protein F5Y12DRAFT_784473 [Xylaria sp. FL1777]
MAPPPPPPPATPTPHRFLVPRRSQPRGETPKPAFQPSSQQFQATPRFSLHSTPRNRPPPPSLTPFRHRGTGRDVVIDSSPPPLRGADGVDYDNYHNDRHGGGDDGYERGRVVYEQDSVVDEDEAVQESSPIAVESDSNGHDGNGERRAKRRRISISPPGGGIEESSSLPDIECELDIEMQDTVLGIESPVLEPATSENDAGLDLPVIQDDIENAGKNISNPERYVSKAQQPTFQKAPRFKPAELPEGAPLPEPLPDAFSPRRKGAKYIPGGLAAELRDWLVDVEAGVGSGSAARSNPEYDGEWVARIHVDDFSGTNGGPRGMTLVRGRQVLSSKTNASSASQFPSEGDEVAEFLGNNTYRLILAGPGRLSGLGVGSNVRPGVLLGIARPTWEVVIDGLGRWGVACDWVVLR